MGDSHAALFAHAGWRPGQVKATYGTGSSVMGLADRDRRRRRGLCLTIAWQDDDGRRYAVEGNIRSSGAHADLAGRAARQRRPAALADAGRGRRRSDGVHLVPAFGGLGAPWWDRTRPSA